MPSSSCRHVELHSNRSPVPRMQIVDRTQKHRCLDCLQPHARDGVRELASRALNEYRRTYWSSTCRCRRACVRLRSRVWGFIPVIVRRCSCSPSAGFQRGVGWGVGRGEEDEERGGGALPVPAPLRAVCVSQTIGREPITQKTSDTLLLDAYQAADRAADSSPATSSV